MAGRVPATETGPSIGVLIVDDQALVRAGFRRIVETEPGLEVVGEATNGVEAVDAAIEHEPDVVLMDIRMPILDGIEATRRIVERDAEQRTRVLILTTFGLDEYVLGALHAGASGFMVKDAPPEDLLAAIRTIAAGEALLSPKVTRTVIAASVRGSGPPLTTPSELEHLTGRELEVLKLLGRGLSNAEIAAEIVVSTATVKSHVAQVLGKLELRDRVQAVIFVYETGIVQPGSG